MSSTPHIKFEHSPADSLADSFVSSPGTTYPSLFPETMNPTEIMTPQSYREESIFDGSMDQSMDGTPAPETDRKPVKKRKSWGQQLPEPKTNLPPRKRAKTEDEKEQRRVERVLRNRRAAQSSRERKRQEVEALEAQKREIERRNIDLEMRLADMEARNVMLQRQLEEVTGGKVKMYTSSVASSPGAEHMRATTPITFSKELFSSHDESSTQPQLYSNTESSRTIDPSSISPEIRPVDESNASSSDMTQHPAAMLCDLQCQSEEQRPWMISTAEATKSISQILAMTFFVNMISAATSMLLNPLSQIVLSLKTGSSLSPTPSILTLIIWLATTTASLTTSTSTISSTTMMISHSLRPRFSLRIRLLRRLLSCSPNLARPLMDATMAAMRLASEQQLSTDCLSGVDLCDHRVESGNSPSLEALMTLLWAIRVIEKERQSQSPEVKLRQASRQLDELFRERNLKRSVDCAFLVGEDERFLSQKSLEGWRPAFKDDRR